MWEPPYNTDVKVRYRDRRNWEQTPPRPIGTENGRFVDLPRSTKQFVIDATASERRRLRMQDSR
jgi:hypothetical protein